MVPFKSSVAGLRSIALLEAMKGAVVILAGCGLLALLHHDIQANAELLVTHLHLNPAKRVGRIFIEAAGHLNDSRLRLLALAALVYAVARFVEAYGLWRGKTWAQWFAVISGGIYLPFEVLELARSFAWLKVVTLTANLIVILYLWRELKRHPGRSSVNAES